MLRPGRLRGRVAHDWRERRREKGSFRDAGVAVGLQGFGGTVLGSLRGCRRKQPNGPHHVPREVGCVHSHRIYPPLTRLVVSFFIGIYLSLKPRVQRTRSFCESTTAFPRGCKRREEAPKSTQTKSAGSSICTRFRSTRDMADGIRVFLFGRIGFVRDKKKQAN